MFDIVGAVKNVTGMLKKLGDVVDDLHLSKEEKLQAHEAIAKIILKLNELAVEVVKIAGDVLKAEIQSDSWLAKNWRPIAMLTFLYIIVHTIILVPLFGFPDVAEAVQNVPAKIWDFMAVGLGGYMGLRTIEKSIDKISLNGLLDKLLKKNKK